MKLNLESKQITNRNTNKKIQKKIRSEQDLNLCGKIPTDNFVVLFW